MRPNLAELLKSGKIRAWTGGLTTAPTISSRTARSRAAPIQSRTRAIRGLRRVPIRRRAARATHARRSNPTQLILCGGNFTRHERRQLHAPLRAEATSRATTSGGNITRHYERTQLHAPLQRPTPCVSFILGVIILQWGQGAGEPSRACYPLLQQYVCRFPGPIRELL